jgi:hypothetical protein
MDVGMEIAKEENIAYYDYYRQLRFLNYSRDLQCFLNKTATMCFSEVVARPIWA